VLLQLLRGGALDALAAMSPRRRPLLGLRRTDTVEICRLVGHEPVEDPSNLDPRHRRNRMRQEVIPLIGSVMGRDPVPLLARAAALAADERDLLDDLASEIDPTDAAAVAQAPPALARRALRRWLREEHPPDAATVERVLGVARGDAVGTDVVGGRRVRRRRGVLRIEVAGDEDAPASSG
jgi:tRNA(Ile)-lysidine synthase